MRIKIGIDTEGLDLGFTIVAEAVKKYLQFNDSVDFILYTLDSNKAELEKLVRNPDRVLIKTSPEFCSATLATTEILRDLNEHIDKDEKNFKYTMLNAIYDSLLKKIDICILPGHAGHITTIARGIERQLGIFNPLFPQCFASFIPSKDMRPRIMLDLGAFLKQDLFKLAVLGEHFIRHYSNVQSPKIAFLNIGSEETKGPQEIREAAAAYKKYRPDGLYGTGFIEPDKVLLPSEDYDVIACNALHGNLVIKAFLGTWKFIELILRDSGPILKLVVGHGLRRILERWNPEAYRSAIIFGYSSLMIKTHGSVDASSMYYSIENSIKFPSAFHHFYANFSKAAKELFDTAENQQSEDPGSQETL